MTGKITDEMIMALADGQLQGEDRDRIRMAIAADPALQAKFDDYQASQRILTEAFAGHLDRPVPAAMQQIVLGKPEELSGVVSLEGARSRRKPPLRLDFLPRAAAAAVLLGAAALSGYQMGQNAHDSTIILAGAVPKDSPLQNALTFTPAGRSIAVDKAQFLAIATYETAGGQVCREFELSRAGSGTVGLACRTGTSWQVEVAALDTTGDASNQFLPASADAFELVGAALEAKGTYEGVDTAQEACILEQRNCTPQE